MDGNSTEGEWKVLYSGKVERRRHVVSSFRGAVAVKIVTKGGKRSNTTADCERLRTGS